MVKTREGVDGRIVWRFLLSVEVPAMHGKEYPWGEWNRYSINQSLHQFNSRPSRQRYDET